MSRAPKNTNVTRVARKRSYRSEQRDAAAVATSARILKASKFLFAKHGIDRVTIAQIAERAEVAASTVYALFKSKEGILRALMTGALFGPSFKEAQTLLDGVSDGARLIALTAKVARAIYESELAELGLLRGVSGFSPTLRKLEQEFENIRYQMQEARVRLLFAQSQAKVGLDVESARRILWMYTSRDIYRMLVVDGGWSADQYGKWLSNTLITELVRSGV
jgi:AcrR family transcriptional regulator